MSAPAVNPSASTAVWLMLAERWRRAIRAKNLSELIERSYLYTAPLLGRLVRRAGLPHRARRGPYIPCR